MLWHLGPLKGVALKLRHIDSDAHENGPSVLGAAASGGKAAVLALPPLAALLSAKWRRFGGACFGLHAVLYLSLILMQVTLCSPCWPWELNVGR